MKPFNWAELRLQKEARYGNDRPEVENIDQVAQPVPGRYPKNRPYSTKQKSDEDDPVAPKPTMFDTSNEGQNAGGIGDSTPRPFEKDFPSTNLLDQYDEVEQNAVSGGDSLINSPLWDGNKNLDGPTGTLGEGPGSPEAGPVSSTPLSVNRRVTDKANGNNIDRPAFNPNVRGTPSLRRRRASQIPPANVGIKTSRSHLISPLEETWQWLKKGRAI
jgi:hypothetical protein